MNDPTRFTPIFQRLIDGAADLIGELGSNPEAFERQILSQSGTAIPAGTPLFNQDMLGFLLFDAKGRRVALPAPDWVPAARDFASLEARATRRGDRLLAIDHDGGTLHLAWAQVVEASGWNLPAAVRTALAGISGGRIAVITGGDRGGGPIDQAARGFGLTDLERRAVVAIISTGNAQAAAAQLGLAYATVREALGSAAARMRQPNMPAVVHAVVGAAYGIMPDDAGGATLLADTLGLSERQARIALLVATGLSREETASAVATSAAVVRKELETVYETLGLASAAELSRLIVEVQALNVLARATDTAPGFLDPAVEPARTTVRTTGREMIGWSDYGPASGKPVLIVHSNWQCRHVPRPLVRALHRRGWRPIAIDRPGFGATHPGTSTPNDPFAQAIDDTLRIIDLLKIDRIAIVARAGAQFVHTLKAAAPDRVGEVVLVSPTVPTLASTRRRGPMGTMKDVFQRPQLIGFYFRVVCSQLTYSRVEQLTRKLAAGVASEMVLCDDPEFIRDRFRAVRPFVTGNLVGAINEQWIISHGNYDFPAIDVDDWMVIQGDDDNHNSLADVEGHWRPILPKARFAAVAGGGRYLTSSHPDLIVEELEKLRC